MFEDNNLVEKDKFSKIKHQHYRCRFRFRTRGLRGPLFSEFRISTHSQPLTKTNQSENLKEKFTILKF